MHLIRSTNDSRSVLRLLPSSCLVLAVLLAGCAGSQRDDGADSELSEQAASPSVVVALRAEREAGLSDHLPRVVPPPPGVEPGALRPANSNQSALSYDEALAELAQAYQPPDVQPRRHIDAVSENAAVRHFIKGREAALSNRHLVAITEFNRALELDPDSATILTALARSHLAMGNQTRASEAYERLLTLKPDDSEALLAAALAAASRGDFAMAGGIVANRRVDNLQFDHDQGAELLANITLAAAFRHLEYDRAGIEASRNLTESEFQAVDQTQYAAQLNAAYRDQAILWRWIGDAHTRLEEFPEALQAYQLAAGFAANDAGLLMPRILFAQLRLGRVYAAQWELLQSLQSEPSSISERDLRLCAYLYEHAQPTSELATAVESMHQLDPQDSAIALAAASLMPHDKAMQLLRSYVERHPRDLRVVSMLLSKHVENDDLQGAVQLVAALAEAHSELSDEYIGKLYFASPRPARLLEAAHVLGPSPMQAEIQVRTLGLLGALGEAWSCLRKARTRWPDHDRLVSLEIDLAIMLNEPALARGVIDEAQGSRDISVLLSLARANRYLGDASAAIELAETAVQLVDSNEASERVQLRVLLEHAQACVALATQQREQWGSRQWAEEAVAIARNALEVDSEFDDAYELLLGLYSPNGPLHDVEVFRDVARELFEANPDSRLYIRLAAEEAINHGRHEQAIDRLIDLYDSDVSDTHAFRLAISAWVRQGRHDAALKWVNDQLARRPGDPTLLEAWAELMVLNERADEAASILENVHPQAPEAHVARRLLEAVYRSTGQAAKAFQLTEARLLARPQGVRRESELAAVYAGAAMREEAIKRARWVIQHIDHATYEQLATLTAVLGRMDPSNHETDRMIVQLVEKAVSLRPDAPLQLYGTAMRSLARLKEIDHRFDRLVHAAAISAQRAAGPSTQHALVWRDLAQALVDEGHRDAAARALAVRAVADVPTDADAKDYLATFAVVADAAVDDGGAKVTLDLVRELASQGRLPRLGGMQEAQSIEAVLFQASQVFGLLGNDAGAETLLREVIAGEPENAMANNNLGYMLVEAGRDDEDVIGFVEQAYELDGDNASILDTIGWLRYKQGRFDGDDGAHSLIHASLEASEEPSAELLDHLGDAAWRLGQHDEAVQWWKQAAELLNSPQQQQRIEQNYLLLQTRGWGLLVADPTELYNREFGERLKRLQQKLQAVEQGNKPPIAETFSELQE